jgi:hypothetical protein
MDANSNQRPTTDELYQMLLFLSYSICDTETYKHYPEEKFGYKRKELRLHLKKLIKKYHTTSYEENPDAK